MPMKVFLIFKKVIPFFLGVLFLWSSLLIFSSLTNKSAQNAEKYLPENANFSFKIKIKDFLKSSTYSMIFKSKDQGLLNSLQKYLTNSKDKFGENNDMGIDFSSDIYVFGEEFENGQNYVILFNLLNPNSFAENIPSILHKNQSFDHVKNVGMIVTHFSKGVENKNISKKLKAYLIKVIKNKRKFKAEKRVIKEADELVLNKMHFFEINLNSFAFNDDFKSRKGNVLCSLDEKSLNITGKIKLKNPSLIESKWTLISDGFHLETAIISNEIQDTIQKYLNISGIKTPSIERISMNYYGMELQESENGLIVAPLFDILLTFREEFKISQVFKDFSILGGFGYKMEKNKVISAAKINYFIDSIDTKNLFIGRNLKKVIRKKNNTLFELVGDPKHLTTLKGGGFLASFIQVFPPFKASNDFFKSVDEFHIECKQINQDVKIFGELKFKNEYYLYNEFIKFYLTMKGEN